MTRAILAAALMALGITGCAQNAAFELTLDLPPASGPNVFVLTQPRRAAENPFEDEWRGDDLEAVMLTDARTEDHISVMGDDETTDLHVKVRFCTSEDCTAIEDDMAPERWYALEHPFYIGSRTFYEITITEVPAMADTTAEAVERCQIRGCVEGILSSYCRVDGRHLCE